MRYNWNALINAVAYLTDEPDADGPLTGKGYSVERQGPGSFIIHVSELAVNETPEAPIVEVPATPENPSPNLAPFAAASPVIPTGNSEAQAPTPSVPVDASESAPTPVPTVEVPAPTPTGQGETTTTGVPTGQ